MFTKNIENNLDQALITLRISQNAQVIFKTLLSGGTLRASSAAKSAGIPRELTYRALEELEEKELIKKIEPKHGVALFQAVHPEIIIKKLKESVAHVDSVQNVLRDTMSTLVGTYNKGIGIPTVEFKEGIEGLKYLYNDIINEGQDIYLIRSPLDVQHPEIKEIIKNHREEQKKNGMHTFMITSFTNPALTLEEVIERDKKYLVERHLAPRNLLNIPAQIKIYGQKVAITSFDGQIITTIIENKAIRDTFLILFKILWSMGKPVSELIKKY
jgi:sugar-specific transcriptional regulator TrmB